MQLTINSEDIVGIKMSTLEESQDNQVSELINDLKKEIQNDVKDDLKVTDEKVLEETDVMMEPTEYEADNIDVEPEIQTNGSGEDVVIPNEAPETPNNDKENDEPKDSETVLKLENKDSETLVKLDNNIGNTANSNNRNVEITKNQATLDNMDTGNDNLSTEQDKTAKEDVVNSVIDNIPTINYSDSEAPESQPLVNEKIDSEIPNLDNAETLNDKPLQNNERVHAELVSDSNSMEISAVENTEHNLLISSENDKSSIVTEEIKSIDCKENSDEKEVDVNSSQMEIDIIEDIDNSSKDVVDKSTILESNDQLELPAEIIEQQNETTNSITKDFNEFDNVPTVEQNELLKQENKDKSAIDISKMPETQTETRTDDDKKHNENTNQSEDIADPTVISVFFKTSKDKISSLNDSVDQVPCKNDIDSVTEETKTESDENTASDKVIDSTISDATSTVIETNNEKQTDNEIIVDVFQTELKREPIDDESQLVVENTVVENNVSDDKSNEISVKTEVEENDESEFDVDDTVMESNFLDDESNEILVKTEVQENDDSEFVAEDTVIQRNFSNDKSNVISVKSEFYKNDESEFVAEDTVIGNNFSNDKSNEISVKSEVQQNDESEFVDEDSVIETNISDDKSNEISVKSEVQQNDESGFVAEDSVIESNISDDKSNKISVQSEVQQNAESEFVAEDTVMVSNFSDDKNNKILVETEVQQNDESEFVVANSVIDKLKDTDCVSVSSMEVDDVEIVPTEKVTTEISNVQDDTTDVSVINDEDNIIEIFDQDVVEPTNNVESEGKPETILDSKKDQTSINEETGEDKVDISDEEDIKIVENTETKAQTPKKEELSVVSKPLPVVCKLSNTLDILSDEEDEPPSKVSKLEDRKPEPEDKQCIDIDDDDDIMLIEDTKEMTEETVQAEKEEQKTSDKVNDKIEMKETSEPDETPTPELTNEAEPVTTDIESPKISEKEASPPIDSVKEQSKPLLPINFLKSAKKNLAEMTRDELEEFCILKIVEGIVDRSSLSDIKSKIKQIERNMEEYKKRAMLLSKQNRDLQVVLKSVQEEQKNQPNSSITPLKITRSVGMQVLMLDKAPAKKPPSQNTPINKPINRNMAQLARSQKAQNNNQNIPVPRLIPASPAKSTPSSPIATIAKPQFPNGIRSTASPALKAPEKRRQPASNNMTVDLTDDEPPAKVNKSSPVPPVRLVPSQNLMPAPVRGQMQTNNQRKVFIPINGQGHTLVRGQTAVMLKGLPHSVGPRQRLQSITRMASNPVRFNLNRHPAPLPDVMKQYQPPTWKALPPPPDLKLAKVENGIVISWKIEGYQEDSYETIASYQLYAYQETSVPPSTALWKKIGDVKALPLPMACTLTQFMAGFKYYFAVRAVDVKSRLGPFSLPGSILLLSKM